MVDIDEELLRRAVRFCEDAGRAAPAEEVRVALAPLNWDELLALRALLADPPARGPLGPFALADLARGRALDEVVAHEQAHLYPPSSSSAAGPQGARRSPPRARHRSPGPTGPRIRRARDRAPQSPTQASPLPVLDTLFAEEGRAKLERLLRQHGARRGRLVGALAAGYRKGDGSEPGEADLEALLAAHGLSRTFAHRERDELLYALRGAGGLRAAAAESLGLSPEAFQATVRRLDIAREVETIRTSHREELRHRATLSERVRLFFSEEERLKDLDLLPEVERDLRSRLPEHLRALRASSAEPLGMALARSLGIPPRGVASLVERLGLDRSLLDRPRPQALPSPAARAARGGRPFPQRSSPGPGTSRGAAKRPSSPRRRG